jgi:hypothetical protein
MPTSPRQTAAINTQPGIEIPSIVQSTLAALPAAGHHFADDFEQRKHLQQVVERRSAGGHCAGRLMLNPHVPPSHPSGRCRGEEHESGVGDGAVVPHAMQACEEEDQPQDRNTDALNMHSGQG